MKVKTKKQLNLPQLIEWAWDNKIKSRAFYSNTDGGSVYFDGDGDVYVEHEIAKTETFTVEVEEEITEDTEFEKLYYTTILSRIVESSCTTIQSSLKHIAVEPIAFYILNDDLTMTLIWRDGKLIE